MFDVFVEQQQEQVLTETTWVFTKEFLDDRSAGHM